MPSKTAHICEIKTSEGFDRVRFEPDQVPEGEKPMEVGGKRVLRKFGFKGDESELIAYHFREKDGWKQGAAAARSWCGEHDGTFMPMTKDGKEATVSVVYLGPHEGQGMIAARLPDEGEDLVWHILLPFGHVEHPLYGRFDILPDYGAEMVANFDGGYPLSLGIPIDEDNLHGSRREGAYGWIRALEVREAGEWGEAGVYGGILWTPAGVEAVDTKALPYVSPRYWVGPDEHPTIKRRNLIMKAALCSYPWFTQQPELRVATADYVRTELPDPAASEPHRIVGPTTAGGAPMEQLMKQAREAYQEAKGPVTDEKWAEITAGFKTEEDWQGFLASLAESSADEGADDLAKLRADIEARDKELAELRGKLSEAEKAAEEAEKAKNDLNGRLTLLEHDKQEAEVKQELAATRLEGGFAYTSEAVGLLATMQLDPGPAASKAVLDHMAAYGGKMATMPLGEVPMLTATTDRGEQTDEAWLAAKGIPDDTKDRTRKRAAKEKIGLREAYDLVIKEMSQ